MNADVLSTPAMSGLRPTAWVCVGVGFSREDVKAVLLRKAGGFVAETVVDLPGLARRLAGVRAEAVVSGMARQEVLRLLLSEPRISERMPELNRLRRQSNFFRRLDLAMQSGRMAFAHEDEAAVLDERLVQRFGPNPVRAELQSLYLAYETWLRANELWDPPMLLARATERLAEGWPPGFPLPHSIDVLSVPAPESRERAFWEAMSRHVEVRRIGPRDLLREPVPAGTSDSAAWERWHTADDAAERLADALLEHPEWSEHVVLIPDLPGVRRSLYRALDDRGIPLADPRDPQRLRTEETLKQALLPLEVVARNYERKAVLAWLKSLEPGGREGAAWAAKISELGIRSGIAAYDRRELRELHLALKMLERYFGGKNLGGSKRTCEELGLRHLEYLAQRGNLSDEDAWVVPFFESVWKQFVADIARVGLAERRSPLLYWLERLKERLNEARFPPGADAKPRSERFKADAGVRIYRLHQAPFDLPERSPLRLWIFGLPSQWLSGELVGDAWFGAKERESLGGEFGLRSSIAVAEERREVLRAWLSLAGAVSFLDFEYEAGGRERESILPVLRELECALEAPIPHGAHPRWLGSHGALRPSQPGRIELEPQLPRAAEEKPEITATTLDRMSRCGFQALALQRWRLRDLRDPDTELWPDIRGNLLHQAVRLLLQSRAADGSFGLSAEQAVEEAWAAEPPRGFLGAAGGSARIRRYVVSRLVRTLNRFLEKEREYFERAGTSILSMDDTVLRMEYPGFSIRGQPDRVDEHADGLFIADYKTSSSVPTGTDMLELGYRLQLAFYAVAANRHYGKPVLGVQFIELNKSGSRNNGVFFSRYNGKTPGCLTQIRAGSRSVFDTEPADVWLRLEESVVAHAEAFVRGRFEVNPKKKDKECPFCPVSDLCGLRRRGTEEETPDE